MLSKSKAEKGNLPAEVIYITGNRFFALIRQARLSRMSLASFALRSLRI